MIKVLFQFAIIIFLFAFLVLLAKFSADNTTSPDSETGQPRVLIQKQVE